MTLRLDVTVEVEAYEVLDELDDQDMVDELISRGYSVAKTELLEPFSSEDATWLKWLILNHCDMPHDMQAWLVYEKLRAMT